MLLVKDHTQRVKLYNAVIYGGIEYLIKKYFDKKPRRSIIAECVSERTYQRWLSQIFETAEQWSETLGVL